MGEETGERIQERIRREFREKRESGFCQCLRERITCLTPFLPFPHTSPTCFNVPSCDPIFLLSLKLPSQKAAYNRQALVHVNAMVVLFHNLFYFTLPVKGSLCRNVTSGLLRPIWSQTGRHFLPLWMIRVCNENKVTFS